MKDDGPMSAVVGIDLGTTNTVVACVQDGHAAALPDEAGERLIPSVVSLHPSGQVIVGRAAKARRLQDPRNTIFSVKRLIGRPWASEDVQRARKRVPFDLREGSGHAVTVVARGEPWTLSEISAFVLRKAKAVAEAALGRPVEKAVITVPANFNDLQRAATKVSGRVANLDVVCILNEPTAAALAYGYGKSTNERVAIYDFGGGTFDVTLMDLSGNVFEVLATSGDTFLGGDDLDLAIADQVCEAFLRQHRYDPRSDPQVFEHVRLAAEEAKHRLSRETQTVIELQELAFGPGGRALGIRFPFTRTELEKLAAPFVDRTLKVCNEAMATAQVTPRHFDQVILVGGSTRIPLVRQRVTEFFGREPLAHINPDEVVAIGAAIQAAALSSQDSRRSSHNLGGSKVPTLKNLGGAAQEAQTRSQTGPQPTTARGLGNRSATLLHGGVPPTQGLNTPLPLGAGTEQAPTTVDYTSTSVSTPPVQGTTKLSLNAQAQQARSVAEDSILSALPLVGLNLPEEPPPLPPPRARMPTLQAISPPPAQLHPTPAARTETLSEFPDLDLGPELHPAISLEPVRRPSPPPAASPPAAPPPIAPPPPAVPTAIQGRRGATVALAPAANPAIPPVGFAPPPAHQAPRPTVPVLIDVTPLSLSVETVGGYCDSIISRNTPIPCDGTRIFATASNFQRSVLLRIAQGESKRFSENTVLGELELTGLREAPRGEVEIAVTFEIDTDGLLQVRARDVATGRETTAQIRLIGAQDNAAADAAKARQNRQIVV